MKPTVELIREALENAFHPILLDVKDDRMEHIGHAHHDSGHFTVIIQSPLFVGKKPVEQHRMIYVALGTLMQTHIHALQIQIRT